MSLPVCSAAACSRATVDRPSAMISRLRSRGGRSRSRAFITANPQGSTNGETENAKLLAAVYLELKGGRERRLELTAEVVTEYNRTRDDFERDRESGGGDGAAKHGFSLCRGRCGTGFNRPHPFCPDGDM